IFSYFSEVIKELSKQMRRFVRCCKTSCGIAGLTLAAMSLLIFYLSLPKPLFRSPTSFVIEDTSGKLLAASIAADGQWRFPATDEVPEKFAKCITTFEDKRFYYHPGIDPIALARALGQNIGSRRIVSGGSTISMQVVRMSRGQSRTIWQKLIEAFLAIRLEVGYSKADILKLYAANAPFGSNVVGLDAAAWRYFGRAPHQLSWAETAVLAVLPNAPGLIHPGRNRDRLLVRRDNLLDKLATNGTINQQTANLAKLEPLPDKPHPLP